MITEKDLNEAIAECQGQRNPNSNTCVKLAAYYTIKDAMFGPDVPRNDIRQESRYVDKIDYDGQSEFASIINGQDPYKVFDVIEELMDTLQVLNPKLYESVLQKLST